MKKIILNIVLAALCLNFTANAQNKTAINALKIGDTVPDITINNIINYKDKNGQPATTAKISDFRGKLLILDFWDTYCAPCIRLLPHFDSLQKGRRDLQFLLVTHESKAKALSFFKKHKFSLPSVTDDTLLTALFEHRGVPYEVWIKNGRIFATTFGDDVNNANIEKALNDTLKIENRIDDLSWDNTKPLLLNGNGGRSKVFTYSVITPYIKGIIPLVGFDKNKERINSILTNIPVVVLYQQAFSHIDPLFEFDNRLIINVSDSLKNKIRRPMNAHPTEWMKSYTFCYNLVLPAGLSENAGEVMKNDLNRFFETYYGINGHLEKREMDCLVLSCSKGYDNLKTKSSQIKYDVTGDHIILQNIPFQDFVNLLGRAFRKLDTPVINETGFTGPVDLHLNAGLADLSKLQNALKESCLSLTLQRRMVDMLVIEQANSPSSSLTNSSPKL